MLFARTNFYFLFLETMQEINPIKNKLSDLKSRVDELRGYL